MKVIIENLHKEKHQIDAKSLEKGVKEFHDKNVGIINSDLNITVGNRTVRGRYQRFPDKLVFEVIDTVVAIIVDKIKDVAENIKDKISDAVADNKVKRAAKKAAKPAKKAAKVAKRKSRKSK